MGGQDSGMGWDFERRRFWAGGMAFLIMDIWTTFLDNTFSLTFFLSPSLHSHLYLSSHTFILPFYWFLLIASV